MIPQLPLRRRTREFGFTLVELLVVIGIIAVLAGLLLASLSSARHGATGIACISNQRQIGLAAQLYMSDRGGGMFHHHEGWVLDDGSQVDELPSDLSGAGGGGMGASDAEKPWVIFLQPYLKTRQVAFCPADRTPRSRQLSTDLIGFNGGITLSDQSPPPPTVSWPSSRRVASPCRATCSIPSSPTRVPVSPWNGPCRDSPPIPSLPRCPIHK